MVGMRGRQSGSFIRGIVLLAWWLGGSASAEAPAPDARAEPKIVETRGAFQVSEDKIKLEYVLLRPDKEGKLPAVAVTHPDPRLGGSLHSHVVGQLAKDLAQSGYVALKFNFRGVGASEGGFADGVGEQRDVLAALEFLKSLPQVDSKRLFLAGYSFGSAVALEVALQNPEIVAYASVGYPNDCFKHADVSKLKNPAVPVIVVGGTEDKWCRIDDLGKVFADAKLKATVKALPDVDHFFRRPDDLKAAVTAVVQFIEAARAAKERQ
jgi:alpha/beta superfamily hydrolase